MKAKDLAILGFAVVLVAALAYLWLSPSGSRTMPDVAVETLDGEPLRLQSLRGRPILVAFWATTCPTCVEEIPELARLHRDLGPEGLTVVAIAMAYDPPPQVRQMVAERDMPYTVVLDRSGEAAKAFGDVQLTPTHFLIAPDGRIVQQKLGNMDMAKVRARIRGMLDGGAA